MRLVATLMLALEVFFLKLKHFILTGIAVGLIALKLQEKTLHPLDTRLDWCPDPELNQGHVDFQSTALPTELSGLIGRGGRI